MPALLLQKPSKPRQTSEGKYHLNALDRRLQLLKKIDVRSLLFECEAIQMRLASILQLNNNVNLSRRLAKLIEKGNGNGALGRLRNNMINGISPLNGKAF